MILHHRVFLALIVLAGALAPATPALAQEPGTRTGVSLGGRGTYFRPADADEGEFTGGAQLRAHLGPVFGLEVSADYWKADFGPTRTETIPVQASLMAYLYPGYRISPYILGGGGWYYTDIRGTRDRTEHRFGPHAGGGIEVFLNRWFSIDAGYRYIWLSRFNSQDASAPLGRDIDDSGHQATAALNLWF